MLGLVSEEIMIVVSIVKRDDGMLNVSVLKKKLVMYLVNPRALFRANRMATAKFCKSRNT